MLSGMLNVDKPKGLTSHDVVDLVRRASRIRKVGHAGTLDPIATGVLPICIGPATRLSEFLTAEDKEYEMVCRFGVETDTHDVTGETLAERPVDGLDLDAVQAVLPQFRGDVLQVPPMVSAKRVQGKRLYDLARQGIVVEREPTSIHIAEIEILGFESPDLRLRVRCSKGTYVRTLCHDIGAVLGCGAAMAALVRTRCGSLSLDTAVDVAELKDPDSVAARIMSPDEALLRFPAVVVRDTEINSWMTGRAVRGGAILSTSADYEQDDLIRIKSRDGRLVGLARAQFTSRQVERLGGDLEVLKPVKVFHQPFSPGGNG